MDIQLPDMSGLEVSFGFLRTVESFLPRFSN
jgi:hypothetical protein